VPPRPVAIEPLLWRDPPVAEIELPNGVLKMTLGLGSGLARRPGAPPGRLWGITDRGPNLKIPAAVEAHGLAHLARLADVADAKILPLPDLGPTLAEIEVGERRVELVRTLAVTTPQGRPISGRPPTPEATAVEPAFDLEGRPLPSDPDGADTEALAVLSDGSFWIAEEYGPSLIRLSPEGVAQVRWTPAGVSLPGAACPIADVLPAAARLRRRNRGFEGLAVSPDETRLYVAVQSALEIDGAAADEALIWTLDAATGACLAEHRYPFDRPASFRADRKAGRVGMRDLKICELVCLAPERLLVLERISRSSRIYAVRLGEAARLEKTLLYATEGDDGAPADIEGMAPVAENALLLASDNDFGTEGQETRFVRVVFDRPLV
jgi:hypothetical protein